MTELLTLGQMLSVHARLSPDKIGARDLERAMTFRDWNTRACRLANALGGLGLVCDHEWFSQSRLCDAVDKVPIDRRADAEREDVRLAAMFANVVKGFALA